MNGINSYKIYDYSYVQSYFIAENFRGVQFSWIDDFHNFFFSSIFIDECDHAIMCKHDYLIFANSGVNHKNGEN